MKIVSINSSFRDNGNTQKIIESLFVEIKDFAEKNNQEITYEEIFLGKEKLLPCIGCRACFNKGEQYCPNQDNLLEIYDKIQTADAVILASPIYVEDINGTMKTFIDRMAFNSHRPSFYGIPLTIITTSGAGASNHALKTLKRAFNAFGFNTINKKNFVSGGNINKEPLTKKYQKILLKFSQDIVKYHVEEKKNKPSLYSLMVFSIQQKYWSKQKDKLNSFDYKYWQKNGWLERKSKYYFKLKKYSFKIFLARFFGNMISRLFY